MHKPIQILLFKRYFHISLDLSPHPSTFHSIKAALFEKFSVHLHKPHADDSMFVYDPLFMLIICLTDPRFEDLTIVKKLLDGTLPDPKLFPEDKLLGGHEYENIMSTNLCPNNVRAIHEHFAQIPSEELALVFEEVYEEVCFEGDQSSQVAEHFKEHLQKDLGLYKGSYES
jgi:hypothetical protein